jgi:MFS family permease
MHRNNSLAVGSLALSMLLASLGTSIANVALPTLTQSFGASFHAVQWVVLAYLLAITIAIVSAGRLGDLVGHRRVLLGGIALFTAAAAGCAVAPTLGTLIAARAAQGVGAAVLMALTMALVRAAVPRESTGRAMGLLGTTSAVGTALGPSLGGVLIAGPGWRAIFAVMVPLGLLNLVVAGRRLPADRERARLDLRRFDRTGTLVLGVALAAYALAVTVSGRTVPLLAVAAVGTGVFLYAESRVAAPLIRLAEFRNRLLSGSLAMNALVATVMMTTLVVGPFYLASTLGLGAAAVGLVMSIGPVLSALTGIPAGRLVDRRGAPAMVTAGLVAMAGGCVGLVVLPAQWGVIGYVVAFALLTPGYQLFLAANNTAVMVDVGVERRGVVSGMLNLSRNLGLITGASVMGAVFAAASSTADVATAGPGAVATGMRITFAVAAGLIAVATAVSVIRSPASAVPAASPPLPR